MNEISQRFSVEPPNASQQLAVLRNKNIIVARKEGANVYYSVSDPALFKLLDAARDIFNNHLVGVRGMLEAINLERPGKRHATEVRVWFRIFWIRTFLPICLHSSAYSQMRAHEALVVSEPLHV